VENTTVGTMVPARFVTNERGAATGLDSIFWRQVQRWACADAFLDVSVEPDQVERAFDEFVRADGQRLRRVMSSQYGVDIGCDSTDSALAWAWEHWDRLCGISNPAGYLYRVAQTQARRAISSGRPVTLPPEPTSGTDASSSIDVDLADALRQLPDQQRLVVLMVHVYGWTPIEVGRITGTPAVTVRSHLRRGLRHLRTTLSKGTTP
jgi:RNA polymerase sigma factor (sigma-70 family)